MIQIKISDLELTFGKQCKKNHRCIGLDVACKTGWCRITTTDKVAKFDFGFVDVKSKDQVRFNDYISIFNNILVDVDTVIIEDTYFGCNVQAFKLLNRLGAFAYCLCELKHLEDKRFVAPSASRSFLGLDSKAKKEVVQEQFHAKMPRFKKVIQTDEVDSIILALNGILEDPKMEV